LMRLKASLPAYRQIEVEARPNETVKELKATICEKLDIEPELTKLLLRGKPLSEKLRVAKLKTPSEPLIVDYLWARHLILWGPEGQQRIRSATILLAGAGAIGNEVAKNLALLGVRRLFIVDRDNVELSNVSRMIFFEPSNLGMNKAEVLARNISRKYPFVENVAFRGELEKLPLKFYLDSDVVVCGLDNVVSRIFLAQTCRKYSIPMVDGGITGLNCRVHVYIPPEDPCPICMFPPNQYSQIVGLRNPCDAPLEEETVPSLATSISLVSSIIAQETIKVILGLKEYRERARWPNQSGEPLRSVLFIDLKNNRFTPMSLKKGEKCFVCGNEGTARDIVPRRDLPFDSIRDSKETLGATIRSTVRPEGDIISVLSETARGSKALDEHLPFRRGLSRGDYLRILAESKNSELRESILRLT
jgi:molybdopterin/thiamine biosynthesis adenylyltransferase